MDLGLEGKVAVVTGAGKGIGMAVTRELAGEGATVVAGSRSTATLEGLDRVTPVAVDLAAPGGPAVVVTGVPWRTGWRYRERGYRHIYWDAGTMLAQLLALADSAGLPARLYTRFPDAEVAALTGVDRVHEFPVAVVARDEAPPAGRAW